jgi:hypothetical protein
MLEECLKGNHTLKVISTQGYWDDSEKVVRWCSVCGAIVVDADFDNRTNPGYYMGMKFPEITKNLELKEN